MTIDSLGDATDNDCILLQRTQSLVETRKDGPRLMHLLYIGLFGALGCLSRYFVSGWTYALLGRGLPYGTLMVNVVGSFLLGFVMEFSLRSALLSQELRMGITVGFMGGFTTFSTFSYETLRLLEDGSIFEAGGNVLLNVLVCLLFTWAGFSAARQF